MKNLLAELSQAVPLGGLLGYLNYSTGRTDPRFARGWNEAWATLRRLGEPAPWLALPDLLLEELERLRQEGTAAFKDAAQAEAVLRLLKALQPAYIRHHRDLLRHQSDEILFDAFFMLKAAEAILNQGGPWEETERILAGAIAQLNDYVGYRPIAVLENVPKGEFYDHERHRPLPLFLRGVGTAPGRYQRVVEQTLEILRDTQPGLLEDACLDLELLDEWAMDLRAYDHLHPVNRRPNYIFGEWDPHLLDNQGRYRRLVSRQVILDALVDRLPQPSAPEFADRLYEAGAVLAGTVLMASAIGGRGPAAFDSSVSLANLVPRIARLRDEFYAQLLEKQSGERGDRWREEAEKYRQPFGQVRQQLNAFMANARAKQLQQRRQAIFFAELGYLEAGRKLADAIATPAARIVTEIQGLLAAAFQEIGRGQLEAAARRLPLCEDLLHRGIHCGALVDPWNILGFQAQFPLFQASEDSVHDPRVDELLHLMDQLFTVQARLYAEAAATGQTELLHTLPGRLRRLAESWDRYATFEVGGVQRVKGSEYFESAEMVAKALDLWHRRGQAPADLAFWKQQLKSFADPKCYGLVLETLLRKQDFQAAMGLLINWLSQAGEVPLEDGEQSFPILSLRWLTAVLEQARAAPEPVSPWPLIERFCALLEANAEELWEVPRLNEALARSQTEDDNPFAAAYEGMTFQDSADDGREGSVAETGPDPGEFALEDEDDRLGQRLRFLSTVARLWRIVARQQRWLPLESSALNVLHGWLETAEARLEQLLQLTDDVQRIPVAEPSGSYESVVEYDRRRVIKERALESILAASLDFVLAVRSLRGVLEPARSAAELRKGQDWATTAVHLERALNQGDSARAKALLPLFARQFEDEPLLYAPLDSGGEPRKILETRTAQVTLRDLVERLPRQGLLRQTYQLLRQARDMEQQRSLPGRQITEFNHLFQTAFQEVVTALVDSSADWDLPARDVPLVKSLETLLRPFLMLWLEHSQTVRLCSAEMVQSESAWNGLQNFIRQYGGELFTAKFMILGNLRGILSQGVENYFDYLENDPEAEPAPRLLADLQRGKLSRDQAQHQFSLVLKIIVESYEEFKDYNSTTTQSDYGDNLYRLIAFLRLKANYDRHAWNFRPYLWAHEVLCRKDRFDAARIVRRDFAKLTAEIAKTHLDELKRLQQAHGMALRTVADYIGEAFVRPMEYDELAALVEPAYVAACEASGEEAFEGLAQRMAPLAAQTSGIGLEVPNWLRRLEQELERIQEVRSGLAVRIEPPGTSRVSLPLDELQRQLREWDLPLDAAES